MRSYRLIILVLFIQQAVALGPVGHMRVVVDNWDATFYPVLGVPITDKDAITAAMVGALAPDAGYMVDRMEYFTDLAHYVRSGELATNLFHLAQTPKYSKDKRFMAFALGFSTHYWADRYGHYIATNRLVSALEKAEIDRVTYEHNVCYHTWVETQLSMLDIKEAPQILGTGFLEYIAEMGDEPNASFRELYEFLKEGVESIYPASEVAFSVYDFLRFYRLATGALCMMNDVAAYLEPGKPCPSCPSCKTILSNTGSQAGTQSNGSTLGRYGRLIRTPLGLNPELVQAVYGEARRSIRMKVTTRPNLDRENFNLDTNVPSRAGQYQCADSAFQKAAAQARSLNPSTVDQKQAVKDFSNAFDTYKNGGNHLRDLFGGEFTSSAEQRVQPEMPTYLFDIYPPASSVRTLKLVQAKDCSSKTSMPFKIGQTTFHLQPADHTICYSKSVRTIEGLYAQVVARGILDRTNHGKMGNSQKIDDFEKAEARDYAEGIDRLRLDPTEPIDSGLYKQQSCAVCRNLSSLPPENMTEVPH